MNAIKKAKGLGRGLEALLGPTINEQNATGANASETVQLLPVPQLQAGKYQPRTRMDEGALSELAESIRRQGVMQPILVRPVGRDKYEIIAGERRFRASQIAGLTEVPVIVRAVSDDSALAMALIENIQREDLSPLEEAQGVARLIKEFSLTHEEAAEAIGRSRSATSNLLRLLNLAEPVQTMLLAGDLEMGHARALLSLAMGEQVACAHEVVNKRLTVRETEKLVAQRLLAEEKSAVATTRTQSPDVVHLQEKLSDWMAAPVQIKTSGKGAGQITVKFGSLDELDGILNKWSFTLE